MPLFQYSDERKPSWRPSCLISIRPTRRCRNVASIGDQHPCSSPWLIPSREEHAGCRNAGMHEPVRSHATGTQNASSEAKAGSWTNMHLVELLHAAARWCLQVATKKLAERGLATEKRDPAWGTYKGRKPSASHLTLSNATLAPRRHLIRRPPPHLSHYTRTRARKTLIFYRCYVAPRHITSFPFDLLSPSRPEAVHTSHRLHHPPAGPYSLTLPTPQSLCLCNCYQHRRRPLHRGQRLRSCSIPRLSLG